MKNLFISIIVYLLMPFIIVWVILSALFETYVLGREYTVDHEGNFTRL